MTTIEAKPTPRVPHWLIRTIWLVHRRAYAITGGRLGLRTPTATPLGDAPAHDRRPPLRANSGRHPRLHRGRAEHRRAGDERVDGSRSRLVAEPPGTPRDVDPVAGRRDPGGDGSSSPAGGAGSPVACTGRSRDFRLHGRERRGQVPRNRHRGPRTALSGRRARSRASRISRALRSGDVTSPVIGCGRLNGCRRTFD